MFLSGFRPRRVLALTAVAGLVMAGAACSSPGSGSGGKNTFVFGASSDPAVLDPFYASDGETFRVSRQIFEGLVSTKPQSADPAPGLASSWTQTPDGLSYTFELRSGVKFHDGTDFNAEAVCTNFERWYNQKGLAQNENVSYYYFSLFRGFKENGPEVKGKPLYQSCKADGATKATVTLTEPFAGFIAALSLPSFSMQSPEAMKKYSADNVSGDAKDPRFGEYGTAHPTGTGPFKFESWDRGQKVTLAKFDGYWGDKAKIDKAVVQTIKDPNARVQALKNKEIDGYDLVAPADLDGLKSAGFQIQQRKPFTILYMGMNQATPALKDIRVRQAIAYAIDKDAVAKQSLPAGSQTAIQFIPDTVNGYNPNVTKYAYDPAKAKSLLAEAGQTNLTLKFNYPTGVSRPYMPKPEDTFVALKSQLEAVGIKVTPVTDKWSPDYLDKVQGTTDQHDLHLLGWTGDYNDTDNFIGVFFGQEKKEWGFSDPALFSLLDEARRTADPAQAKAKYENANKMVMDLLPGIPLAHPVPSLAFASNVKGYEASPVQNEVWNTVTLGS